MFEPEEPARVRYAESTMLIELNRPARGNGLSSALVEKLIAALEEGTRKSGIDTVVFQGTGRHFCTGFDLDQIEETDDSGLLMRFVRIETLLSMVWTSRLRTVSIGMGRVWGAGADLFAACDVRLARPDCKFCFPGAGFGIVLGTRRLSERVGRARARQWTTTGMVVSLSDALESGLVTRTIEVSESTSDLLKKLPSVAVDAETLTRLHEASGDAEGDRDMAMLVRSASRPGLKRRIIEYAARRRDNRT